MALTVEAGTRAYGIQLPIQAQSTVFVEPWEADAGPDELAAVARACDRVGFFYVAVCDHVVIPAERAEAMGTTWFDTVATLGWLAALTERVRLVSHVYVPGYRHPLVTAKAFATLDHLSGGRAVLGVGTGHLEAEFAALGVDFGRRGRILDDAIDAVRAAFARPFVEGAAGPVAIGPRPVQAGGPPIWVGGSSDAAIRRAAERGDGWLPQGYGLDALPDAAARIAEIRDGRPFDLGAIAGPIYLGEPAWDVGPTTVTGPPEKIAHVLGKWFTAGADHVQIRFRSRSATELVDQVEAFEAVIAG